MKDYSKRLRFLGFLLILLQNIYSTAQQEVQVSQYIVSPMLINPAFSSIDDYWETNFVYRNQWVGIQDAPVTYYVSTQTTIGKPHFASTHKGDFHNWHGIAGLLMKDQIGPFSKNRLKANYSYNIGLTKGKKYGASHEDGLRLALGVFADYSSIKVDKTLLSQSQTSTGDRVSNYLTETDITHIGLSSSSDPSLDFELGFMFSYDNTFFLGASSSQILQNQEVYGGYGGLNRHYFITGMVKTHLTEQWFLISSFLTKMVEGAPVSWDLGIQLDWTDKVFLGGGYRHEDAMSLLAGYRHQWGENVKHFRKSKNNYITQIFYNYDITTSRLGDRNLEQRSHGSHEITVGFLLPPKYKERNAESTWKKGNTNNLHKRHKH